MKKLLKEFIERGWVEPSDSEWASPAFIVPKSISECLFFSIDPQILIDGSPRSCWSTQGFKSPAFQNIVINVSIVSGSLNLRQHTCNLTSYIELATFWNVLVICTMPEETKECLEVNADNTRRIEESPTSKAS